MITQLAEGDCLLQVEAVATIEKLFGPEFVYLSNIGEKSIDRRVLDQFRKLTEDEVVWVTERRGGFWSGAIGGSVNAVTPAAELSTHTEDASSNALSH